MSDTTESPATIVSTVRLPAHIHEALARAAQSNRRSVNAQIVTAIENDLIRTRFAARGKSK